MRRKYIMNNAKYVVKIIETATGTIEKVFECQSMDRVEKVEEGININLNHSEYHTAIVAILD
jgi:hypothetical protein